MNWTVSVGSPKPITHIAFPNIPITFRRLM